MYVCVYVLQNISPCKDNVFFFKNFNLVGRDNLLLCLHSPGDILIQFTICADRSTAWDFITASPLPYSTMTGRDIELLWYETYIENIKALDLYIVHVSLHDTLKVFLWGASSPNTLH